MATAVPCPNVSKENHARRHYAVTTMALFFAAVHSKMKPQAYSQLLQATAMCDRTPGCSGAPPPPPPPNAQRHKSAVVATSAAALCSPAHPAYQVLICWSFPREHTLQVYSIRAAIRKACSSSAHADGASCRPALAVLFHAEVLRQAPAHDDANDRHCDRASHCAVFGVPQAVRQQHGIMRVPGRAHSTPQ